jgi:predicted HNH restriction endonuclease
MKILKKVVERAHKSRERNSEVVWIAKRNFKVKHGCLFCEVCGFDFEKHYGKLGCDYIEGHHTIPVSEMKPNHKTKPEDIAMVCSNCHRMLHKRRPWLSLGELKTILHK